MLAEHNIFQELNFLPWFYDLEGSEAELRRKREIKTQGKKASAVAPSPPANAASLKWERRSGIAPLKGNGETESVFFFSIPSYPSCSINWSPVHFIQPSWLSPAKTKRKDLRIFSL